MQFTVGFLLLFLNLFLPGLLFLRFYYRGEFSKEFTTRAPLIRTAFFSLFPGRVIAVGALGLYHPWTEKFTVEDSLDLLGELMTKNRQLSASASFFLNKSLLEYSLYTLIVAAISGMFGALCHYLVVLFRLDLYVKILRFRNQWYYIFSGDILLLKKFKFKETGTEPQVPKGRKKVNLTFVDVLVKPVEDVIKYQGVVADYDLTQDLTKIERLYLRNARKQLMSSNKWTDIPGKFFIVPGDQILNLNVNYIFKEENKPVWPNILKFLYALAVLMSLPYFATIILFKTFTPEWLKDWTNIHGFWYRGLFFLTLWSLLTLPPLFFTKPEKADRKIRKITLFITVALIAICIVLTWTGMRNA